MSVMSELCMSLKPQLDISVEVLTVEVGRWRHVRRHDDSVEYRARTMLSYTSLEGLFLFSLLLFELSTCRVAVKRAQGQDTMPYMIRIFIAC